VADLHARNERPPADNSSLRAAELGEWVDAIEHELRRLPQNLCVAFAQTALEPTHPSRSLFDTRQGMFGRHNRLEDVWGYPLDGQRPEGFPYGTDRFPYGVVLSLSLVLQERFVDTQARTWLNFGGKGGFYVAGTDVRDAPPENIVARGLTEETIWHYFAETTAESIHGESAFAGVNEQLLHCYHVIRETLKRVINSRSVGDDIAAIVEECTWPEVMLYVALKKRLPIFVEHDSIVRSLPGVPSGEFVPFGGDHECHDVFRIRPLSVAQATRYAFYQLMRLGGFAGGPFLPVSPISELSTATPASQWPDRAAAQVNSVTPAPSADERGANITQDMGFENLTPTQRLAAAQQSSDPVGGNTPAVLTEEHPDAGQFRKGGEWCTAKYAKDRYGLPPQALTKAATEEKGYCGVKVERQKANVGGRVPVFVYDRRDLERLSNAIDQHREGE